MRGDLSERMLPILLDRISEEKRKAEDEIWPDWERNHGRILGAVLELASQVLKTLPSVELKSKPRMADFAKILSAVDQVLGTDGLEHYKDTQARLAADSLTGDLFTFAVMQMDKYFKGTSATLLTNLSPDKPPRGWPQSARMATSLLRRAAPAMVKLGWIVEDDGGHNKQKITIWTLTPPPEMSRISSPPDPQTRQKGQLGGLAGVAGQENTTSQDESQPRCEEIIL